MSNNQSRVVVAFDYSNIFYRGLFTCTSKRASNGLFFSADDDLRLLGNVVLSQIAGLIKDLATGCDVVFCVDTLGSWRKDVIKKIDCLSGLGYKEGRKKKEDFDWDGIHRTMQEVLSVLREKGYNILSIPHAEADDMMAFLADTLINKTDCNSLVIVSADEDLRQLVRYKPETGQCVMAVNPVSSQEKDINRRGKRTIYICEEQNEASKETGSFFSVGLSTNMRQLVYIRNCMSSNKYNLDVINPHDILINKLLCGDDGDSIPALYEFYTKTGRVKRITAKPKEYIVEALNVKKAEDIYNNVDLLPKVIGESLKTEILYNLKERLQVQRELVELDTNNFPEELRTLWTYTIEPSILINATRPINPQYNMDITEDMLLADTKFVIEKVEGRKVVEHSVLKELNRSVRSSAVDGRSTKDLLDDMFS